MVDYTSSPLDYPSTGFEQIEYRYMNNARQTTATHTSATKNQVFQGAHLRMSVTVVAPLLRKEAKEWYSFMMALDGPVNAFNFSPPLTGTPDGSPSGSPTVDSISSGNKKITTSGWDADITGALLVGDWIEVNGELKSVIKDVDTDGSGNADIYVRPRFRSDPSSSSVTWTDPTGTFTMLDQSNPSWTVRDIRMSGLSFTAREDF